MFIKRFLKKEKFDNYDDYIQNAAVVVPENFNFAYDVLDVMANESPDKVAVLWVNDSGEKKSITFKMLSEMSGAVANFLTSRGVKKGDAVLLFMRRRWEYWVVMMAMHKLGAIPIPSTNQLKSEDIKFRIKMADVKTIIAFDDGAVDAPHYGYCGIGLQVTRGFACEGYLFGAECVHVKHVINIFGEQTQCQSRCDDHREFADNGYIQPSVLYAGFGRNIRIVSPLSCICEAH